MIFKVSNPGSFSQIPESFQLEFHDLQKYLNNFDKS